MACVEAQGVVLEVQACLTLFGGHARLASAIRRGIRELGFRAALGIAPTPLAARLFARAEAQGLTARACFALEELTARLADLPLFLLDWPDDILARLADLGVLRLRDVLALPASGIAKRFGTPIALSLERLQGRVADPRAPYVAPPRFRARLELPAEAESAEALAFALRRLLAEFEGAARGRGAGAQRFVLTLEHGRAARTRLTLDFAAAEREADFILSIAREKLARLTLAAPTVALELRADTLLAYAPRAATWLPGAREQSLDRERLLERLAARLGRERVHGLSLGDDHRPEAGWKKPGAQRAASAPLPMPGARPVWLLQRPQRLVTEDGAPCLQGVLEMRAGPERIEAGWWDGAEVRRDYYVADNARGETYWIYREHRDPGAWYLHGVFA